MKEKRKGKVLPLKHAEARIRFIPLELWKRARLKAMRRDMTISQYVIEAIKEKVDNDVDQM